MRILTLLALAATLVAPAQTIVQTSAYRWHGDSITQGSYHATAPDAYTIVSTYSAQPGYFMPIDKEWKLKNDITSYPQLSTPNVLHQAIYNMGLDEMVNAVEPDTTLRTGKEWPGVWTRDVSYSILLSMAYMQPEASRISLEKKVDSKGRIIQDTGSGGAWPVSTDRQIWTVAAYEVYLVSGDKNWLNFIYPVIKQSLEDDLNSGLYSDNGLVKGETSFIDWREQSYPRWMQCADIYRSEALGTSVVHARAWEVLSEIATELGHKDVAQRAAEQSRKIADGINNTLWMDSKGYYAMYRYGRDNLITNPRAETLGEALSIVWNIASDQRARRISESNPTTPFGTAIFYPQIADIPAYHNNSLWPWVGAWWGIASAKAGNEQGVMQAIGSVFRPAALFATNKENFVLDNGDIATELNSSNMLWCLAGNLALTHKVLFGIHFAKQGLEFQPFVPEVLGQTRTLSNFEYRGAKLNITISGYGDRIASFTVDGKTQDAVITPAQAAKAAKKGKALNIDIQMSNQAIAPLSINEVPNAKAPLTPITWVEDGKLCWNPIEYIGKYVVVRNGVAVDTVHTTDYSMAIPGEYQVYGVSGEGIDGFASEPRSNRPYTFVDLGSSNTLGSTEVSYRPAGAIKGYRGTGFVETDHSKPVVESTVDIDRAGTYSICVRYANGNGPVNTENKCAIRSVIVDGVKIGTVVMPTRGCGNWDDWGTSNSVELTLTPGRHTVALSLEPENENMNINTNHAAVDGLTVTLK